jgi:hypothetical protein
MSQLYGPVNSHHDFTGHGGIQMFARVGNEIASELQVHFTKKKKEKK